jgi:uncharacterized protein (DUF697 family)
MDTTKTDSNPEQEAHFTICLMAAFADGLKSEIERTELKRISDQLNSDALPVAKIYQDVLYQRVALEQVANSLTSPESRALAYELASCVCEADDAINEREQAFLEKLRAALKLPSGETAAARQNTSALAQMPVAVPAMKAPPVMPASANDAELDRQILNFAILAGALELLPDTLATMAIIPVQMRMVYRIGKFYGNDLDRGHIKEFLATVGVGLTSQVVEGFARKLTSKFLGRLGGGLVRSLAGQATSSGFSFASTYALGHVAKRYYAAGRRLSGTDLKDLFSQLIGEARGLQTQYLPQMKERAGTINVSDLVPLIRDT